MMLYTCTPVGPVTNMWPNFFLFSVAVRFFFKNTYFHVMLQLGARPTLTEGTLEVAEGIEGVLYDGDFSVSLVFYLICE
jgi:hypothetical protein